MDRRAGLGPPLLPKHPGGPRPTLQVGNKIDGAYVIQSLYLAELFLVANHESTAIVLHVTVFIGFIARWLRQ